MVKSKRQVGAVLVHRLNQKVCTILEFNTNKFTVRFEDGQIREYSLGSLESKFNLYDINDTNKTIQKLDIEEEYNRLLKENQELKNKIMYLESMLNAPKPKHAGGRPKKFTDEQIEQMKEYRKQGKSYNKIAKILNCSVGSVFDKLN